MKLKTAKLVAPLEDVPHAQLAIMSQMMRPARLAKMKIAKLVVDLILVVVPLVKAALILSVGPVRLLLSLSRQIIWSQPLSDMT